MYVQSRMLWPSIREQVPRGANNCWKRYIWEGAISLLAPEVDAIGACVVEVFDDMFESMVVDLVWRNGGLGAFNDCCV